MPSPWGLWFAVSVLPSRPSFSQQVLAPLLAPCLWPSSLATSLAAAVSAAATPAAFASEFELLAIEVAC